MLWAVQMARERLKYPSHTLPSAECSVMGPKGIATICEAYGYVGLLLQLPKSSLLLGLILKNAVHN